MRILSELLEVLWKSRIAALLRDAGKGPAPATPDEPAAAPEPQHPPTASADPTLPDLSFLEDEFGAALESFFATIERIERDNPVDAARLQQLAAKGRDPASSRAALREYFLEALRLQPQGEVLLRKCAREGARVAGSRPIRAGTLVFASHGSAMKDVPEPDSFVLGRPPEHYLQYGWNRHTCLGQYVSPVIVVESMIALLGLEGLRRPAPGEGETAFPVERRFGHLQLDDLQLYARSFVLEFDDTGSTRRFWP